MSIVDQSVPCPGEPRNPQDLIVSATFEQMEVEFDPNDRAIWCNFAFKGRPSFTPPIMKDILKVYDIVRECFAEDAGQSSIRYVVWGSRMPGVWNLGGDLNLFAALIRNGDREGLHRYAMSVVDMAYQNYVSLDLPVITIALVQGDALGGGFEGVLSNNFIVAEKKAKFGLPEILFNLFPGMGAYSFLARRITPAQAERMIMSGRIYGAEELYEMGVVDMLAEDGQGAQKVRDFIASRARTHAVHRAILNTRHHVSPLRYDELVAITEIWVDTAMKLEEADLRKMCRLVAAQDRRCLRVAAETDGAGRLAR